MMSGSYAAGSAFFVLGMGPSANHRLPHVQKTGHGPSSHTPDAACICPTDDSLLLECNDDFCGSASTVSGVTIEGVQANACYTIRVGGWSGNGIDTSASRGMSEIDIGVVCGK